MSNFFTKLIQKYTMHHVYINNRQNTLGMTSVKKSKNVSDNKGLTKLLFITSVYLKNVDPVKSEGMNEGKRRYIYCVASDISCLFE